MPTIYREGSYRFFFFAGDREEPTHVHIECDDKIAKFWLDPVRFQNSGGFSRRDINKIMRIVLKNKDKFIESWDEYFNN